MTRGVRTPRAEEVSTERRRRKPGSLDAMQDMRLVVPESAKTDGFEHRWINDQGNRMHQKTVQDDWDKVPGVAPVPVSTDDSGKPIYAHLCRKPTGLVEEDRNANLNLLAEREKGIMAGQKSDPQDDRKAGESYAPVVNSITRAYAP